MLADAHGAILKLNNNIEYTFNDKELHFLVIGVVGMVIFFVVHPIVHFLAKRGYEIIVSWSYTMTLILVLTFGIEIGQKISHTGSMEFADIVFGVAGFMLMFLVYLILCLIFIGIRRLFQLLLGR